MAELTAVTPGTSGGDRTVGHWGWNNFPARIGGCNIRCDPFNHVVRANEPRTISFGEFYGTELD